MQQSQGDAKDVALTRLGYTVTADAPRVTIVQACAGVPAYGIVKVGDQVLAVDDQAVATLDGARRASFAVTHPATPCECR